jgi:hypothetical protein
MPNPLADPFRDLVDEAGDRPAMLWKGAGAGAGIAGAVLARKLIDRIRTTRSRRGDVPLNPGDERMSWPYALVWAGVVGVAASLGRLVAQRIVAAVWARRHHRPVSAMPSAGS